MNFWAGSDARKKWLPHDFLLREFGIEHKKWSEAAELISVVKLWLQTFFPYKLENMQKVPFIDAVSKKNLVVRIILF